LLLYVKTHKMSEKILDLIWKLDIDRIQNLRKRSYEEQVRMVRETLQESVRMQMVSDVPIGAFLSGGIDSTLLVSLMALVSNTSIKTFSVGFEQEGREIDETDDGQLYIVMSCYEGRSLRDRIQEGSIALAEATEIARQLGEGLQAAHARGIVHRDLKPENVMITNAGVVKILDFGLAKLEGQSMLTVQGSTLGTAAYMAPEQVRGESADRRSDIFSFAVVFYELLTSQHPFRGEHQLALMYSIANSAPQRIRLPAAGSPGGENGDRRPNFTGSLATADDAPIPQSKTTIAIKAIKTNDNFLQCKIFIIMSSFLLVGESIVRSIEQITEVRIPSFEIRYSLFDVH